MVLRSGTWFIFVFINTAVLSFHVIYLNITYMGLYRVLTAAAKRAGKEDEGDFPFFSIPQFPCVNSIS